MAQPAQPGSTSAHPTQVHEEFKQNIENVSVEMLLRNFAENKGTGREKPGERGSGRAFAAGGLGPMLRAPGLGSPGPPDRPTEALKSEGHLGRFEE